VDVRPVADPSPSDFDVEVFFDGDCPLCVREIRLLQRLDARGRRIRFTDIQAPGFDLAGVGVGYRALMDRIHARLPTGELITGVEVFRRLYAAVGFRRLVALSRLPVIRPLLDAAYELFAKNRLRFTGRCTPELCDRPGAAPR
jgi:predicted DCC family thiol-disulfide oxidoreductase YuxK